MSANPVWIKAGTDARGNYELDLNRQIEKRRAIVSAQLEAERARVYREEHPPECERCRTVLAFEGDQCGLCVDVSQ